MKDPRLLGQHGPLSVPAFALALWLAAPCRPSRSSNLAAAPYYVTTLLCQTRGKSLGLLSAGQAGLCSGQYVGYGVGGGHRTPGGRIPVKPPPLVLAPALAGAQGVTSQHECESSSEPGRKNQLTQLRNQCLFLKTQPANGTCVVAGSSVVTLLPSPSIFRWEAEAREGKGLGKFRAELVSSEGSHSNKALTAGHVELGH